MNDSTLGDSVICGDPFWVNLQQSDKIPQLSQCFQHTVLVGVPFLFLLILLPVLLVQARRIGTRFLPLPWTFLLKAKILISTYLAAISIAIFIVNTFVLETFVIDTIYPLIWTLFFALHVFIDWNRRRCGQISSGIQHISIALFVLCTIPELHYRIGHTSPIAICVLFMVFWPVALAQFILLCWADKRNYIEGEEKSAELDSSFLNRLTLWWFTALPMKGAVKDLEMDDLFELNRASTSEHLASLFEKYWTPAVKEYKEKKAAMKDRGKTEVPLPSLLMAFVRMYKWEFITATFLKLLSDTLQFANPFLLNQLIGFVSSPNSPLWEGLAYAVLLFAVSECRSIVENSNFYLMFRMGMKIQSALTTAVYRKTMRLSAASRREKTVGEIINLMAIDAEFLQMITPQIQQFLSCAYQIVLSMIYLYYTLGYSAATGFILMLIMIPINAYGSLVIKRLQMRQMKLKDKRTKMVNEVLNGIKVVKLYAWEVPMEEHISAIRNKELQLMKRAGLVKNAADTFNTSVPFLVAAASFGTFILSSSDHLLTPQTAFVSLTLFNQLQMPMNMVAMLVTMLAKVLVSNRRLKAFLTSEELDESVVMKNANAEVSRVAVSLSEVDAAWDARVDSKPTLRNINLVVPRGSLICVVGPVGAGKSSLIEAMLGELVRRRGVIHAHGRLTYVPQQAWMLHGTLRDNITFGKAFERKWYDKVIAACALLPDLQTLPHGDLTEIGEKGMNLSGGQKARISLARAIYHKDDVYLLDDPLSAVDGQVGKHIFNHVIGSTGLLANKTRIVVTHRLHYTRRADEILVMKDGEIAERGTFNSLLRNADGLFAKLLEEGTKASKAEDDRVDSAVDGVATRVIKEDKVLEMLPKAYDDEEIADDERLIEKEGVRKGKVKWAIYGRYLRAASASLFAAFFLLFSLSQAAQMMRSFWLSDWSNENDIAFTGERMNQVVRLVVYVIFGLVEAISFLFSLVFLLIGGLNASRRLHEPLIGSLLRSPISFFDTTPLGRILNRCSKDVDTIDTQLPDDARFVVMSALSVLSTLLMIEISTPVFIVVIIPLAVIYFLVLKFYVPTARQLKRLESMNRSPVYSQFGESIVGATSIRAYRRVGEFCLSSEQKIDTFIRCKYFNAISIRWLTIRLDFIGNCVILFVALFAACSKEFDWGISPGLVGVSVSYALTVTMGLNFTVFQMTDMEANIVSVERVVEYSETPNEANWREEERRPPVDWPTEGAVTFDNYSTRYRKGLDLVLKNLNAHVRKGEKIGLVGWTGAGKSSFASALFRMMEAADGSIRIDNVDIATIGLHDLRESISIIPQDPVLFSGSLRFNLDPFGEYSDEQLWTTLRLVHLESFTSKLAGGLDYVINEGGENISVGQRQLVCLARAALRRTRVLVLDEATAAVDLQTDALIQATIRSHFKDCTLFTIAHRLNTITDYDRIVVLDKGEIVEMDAPAALLADKESLFARMLADLEHYEERSASHHKKL